MIFTGGIVLNERSGLWVIFSYCCFLCKLWDAAECCCRRMTSQWTWTTPWHHTTPASTPCTATSTRLGARSGTWESPVLRSIHTWDRHAIGEASSIKASWSFCTAFHFFVTGVDRDFKFGTYVDHSSFWPADDGSSLKGVWSHYYPTIVERMIWSHYYSFRVSR